MLSGVNYSRKKVSAIAQERFSVENMAYTQMFIDYLHTKDPFKLKFFDECGLKLRVYLKPGIRNPESGIRKKKMKIHRYENFNEG